MYSKLLALTLFSQAAFATPWFTGPLLAPAGKTIPSGHFNFEPYAFYTEYPAGYRNAEVTPILTAGVTDFIDLQTSLPYDYSWDQGQHGNGIGDYSLGLGFQVLRQGENSWLPDFRITVQEVFPTGRYENLSARKLGTDQTGSGAYQTFLGLNFQHLRALQKEHYLRTRFSFVTAKSSSVTVHGSNVFGGGFGTEGRVHGGTSYSADLAFEYTLTQHWVPVFEVLYGHSSGADFDGNPGFTPGGTIAAIGGSSSNSASLAPALEYNFTSNLGLIGGLWFSVTGPHAAKFMTATLAVNYYI